MNALETEINGQPVYTSLLHNIAGINNILETIPVDQLQRTPELARALDMVNAAALETQELERDEYSSWSRSGRY